MLYQWYLWSLSFWYLCSRSPLTFSKPALLSRYIFSISQAIQKRHFHHFFWSCYNTRQYVFLPAAADSIRQGVFDNRLYTRYCPGSHTLQTRLLHWPVVRSSEQTALLIGWCYACRRLVDISTPVQRPCRASDAWSTSLVERCIEDPVQTSVLAFQCRNDVTLSYLASCCIPVASVIGRSFCCFRWLSRSCLFHSDSRSTCVCCFLSGLLELTPSLFSGTWNQSGDL